MPSPVSRVSSRQVALATARDADSAVRIPLGGASLLYIEAVGGSGTVETAFDSQSGPYLNARLLSWVEVSGIRDLYVRNAAGAGTLDLLLLSHMSIEVGGAAAASSVTVAGPIPLPVAGNIAHGDPETEAPVPLGVVASVAAPSNVSAGDRVRLSGDLAGRIRVLLAGQESLGTLTVKGAALTGVSGTATATTTSAPLSSAACSLVRLQNVDTTIAVHYRVDGGTVTTAFAKLAAGESVLIPVANLNQVSILAASGTSPVAYEYYV